MALPIMKSWLHSLFVSVLLMSPWAVLAQVPAELQSPESFWTALRNVDWECSFNSYQRLRFGPEKIDLLGQDGKVTGGLTRISLLEPGIIQVDYSNSNGVVLFVFADDLKSFVVANMNDISEFEITGAAEPKSLPTNDAEPGLEISFKDNPFSKKARLRAAAVELLDDGGATHAANEGFAFSPHALGFKLPDKKVGAAFLSRQKAGGWYLNGRHLGTGVRTQGVGLFRPFLRSKMRDFALRSAHFNRHLLLSGLEQTATAQEQYALYNAINVYGENSEPVIYAMNEMGRLRGYALSFDRAAAWHQQAYTAAKAYLAGDTAKLFEIGTDYAESLGDRGDFAEAKAILTEVQPHLPTSNNPREVYPYYRALGAAEFGLRNYAQAAQIFADNHKRAQEGNMVGSEIESLLDTAACYMALGQTLEAAARVSLAVTRQEEIKKQYPKSVFDTYKLSFACSVMGKWPEATQYSTERQRGSVTYMECARLLSLLCQGNKEAAQKMAKNFSARVKGGLDEIQIRRDIDAMIVSVTQASAEQTPDAIAQLEQTWAQQVESLRKRPLQNYIFARVMVAAIAELKKP